MRKILTFGEIFSKLLTFLERCDIMYLSSDKEVRGMLMQFKFSNFRCFAEEVDFDMRATTIKEHKYSLIDCNGVNILPVAAVYGANASGKTSFFMALERMRTVVIQRSLTQGSLQDAPKRDFSNPFMFEEKMMLSPTNYEVSILINGYQYKYGFSCTSETIIREYLYKKKLSKYQTKDKMIFIRRNKTIRIGEVNQKIREELDYCYSMSSNKVLLLSDIGLREKESELCSIYDWFSRMDIIIVHGVDDFFLNRISERMVGDYISRNVDKDIVDNYISFIHEIDPSIETIETIDMRNSDGGIDKVARTVHVINGTHHSVPFELESDGTNKLLYISLFIFIVLKIGGTLVIDELDSKVHPLILRRIIQLFTDKKSNTNGAQLVFSAHNVICLDSSDLRRDEIWFVEKMDHKSTMYSLVDFDDGEGNIRSDLSFGKHYLSGRFGAVPFQDEG